MFAVRAKGFATFNRRIIKTNWRKINESPAKKAGLLVRKIAIRSIRRDRSKSGNRPSRPGKPPRTRAPGDPLRRIYSVPSPWGTSAMVGPIGFGELRPVTELHEFGGVRTGLFRKRLANLGRDRRGRFAKGRPKMVLERTTVRFPKRPTMRPALLKAIPRLPPMWKHSLN